MQTTKSATVRLADGFAMSRVRGIGAPAGWRHAQAPCFAMSIELSVETHAAGAVSSAARNPQNQAAQLPAIAALPVVTTAAVPATAKQHLVATKGAGRGNKGSSPWRYPV